MKFVKIILSIVLVVCATNLTLAQEKKKVVTKKVVKFTPPVIKKVPGTRIKLTTDSGVIVLRLYDGTPKHRDNFIKLATAKFFLCSRAILKIDDHVNSLLS